MEFRYRKSGARGKSGRENRKVCLHVISNNKILMLMYTGEYFEMKLIMYVIGFEMNMYKDYNTA